MGVLDCEVVDAWADWLEVLVVESLAGMEVSVGGAEAASAAVVAGGPADLPRVPAVGVGYRFPAVKLKLIMISGLGRRPVVNCIGS